MRVMFQPARDFFDSPCVREAASAADIARIRAAIGLATGRVSLHHDTVLDRIEIAVLSKDGVKQESAAITRLTVLGRDEAGSLVQDCAYTVARSGGGPAIEDPAACFELLDELIPKLGGGEWADFRGDRFHHGCELAAS